MFLTGRVFEHDKEQWRIASVFDKNNKSMPNIFIKKNDFPNLSDNEKIQFSFDGGKVFNLTKKVVLSRKQKRSVLSKYEGRTLLCVGTFELESDNGYKFKKIVIKDYNITLDHVWFNKSDDLRFLLSRGLLEGTIVEFSARVEKYADQWNNKKFSLKSFSLIYKGKTLEPIQDSFYDIYKIIGFRKAVANICQIGHDIKIRIRFKGNYQFFDFNNWDLFKFKGDKKIQLGREVLIQNGKPKYQYFIRKYEDDI